MGMADIADMADAKIERHRAEALRRAIGKSGPESDPRFDGENCVDCEEELHPVRLMHGKVRCVLCQQRLERQRTMGPM